MKAIPVKCDLSEKRMALNHCPVGVPLDQPEKKSSTAFRTPSKGSGSMKRANPKQDLLATCNDRGVPPAEFKGFFCSRCRNPSCINAGWEASQA